MVERARLETLWHVIMSEEQRTAWLTRWITRPPRDITGRIYTPFTPTDFHSILVLPSVAYAWSQIYGTLRYGYAPVLQPTAAPEFQFLLVSLGNPGTPFQVSVESAPAGASNCAAIIYGTPIISPLVSSPKYSLRPLAWWQSVFEPSVLDVEEVWVLRWGQPRPGRVALAMSHVNDNNELVAPSTLCELVLS